MKHIISSIVSLLFSCCVFAQEHMMFKGIPIDGSVSSMMSKLKKEGFKFLRNMDNGVAMVGVFSGYESLISLEANSNGDVSKVNVIYDTKNLGWKAIKVRYENLENGLTRKYGEPITNVKDFHYLYSDGSGYELVGFRKQVNEYRTVWRLDNGIIMLIFLVADFNSNGILLSYVDKINNLADMQRVYDDL